MNKRPLIVLTGPTAVGKTALSIALAKAINGEIISADSMQVYRGMDIGSAKITKEQMQEAFAILQNQFVSFEGTVVSIGIAKPNPHRDIALWKLPD